MTVESKGRDLFIVDNSVSGWTGLRYLEEWSGIAKDKFHAKAYSLLRRICGSVTNDSWGFWSSVFLTGDDDEACGSLCKTVLWFCKERWARSWHHGSGSFHARPRRD